MIDEDSTQRIKIPWLRWRSAAGVLCSMKNQEFISLRSSLPFRQFFFFRFLFSPFRGWKELIQEVLFIFFIFIWRLATNALTHFFLNRLLLRQILFLPWFTYCKVQNLTLRRRRHGPSQMLPLEDLMTRLGLFCVCIFSATVH